MILWNTKDLSTINPKAFKSLTSALRTSTGSFVHSVDMVLLPITHTKSDFFPALNGVILASSIL